MKKLLTLLLFLPLLAAAQFVPGVGASGTSAGSVATGGGGGAVSSVSAGNSNITVSPTTGAVVVTLSTTPDIGTATGTSLTLSGGGAAGYVEFAQGTATTAGTSSVGFQAPTSVTTKFHMTLPGAPTTGYLKNTGTSDPGVITFAAQIPAADVAQVVKIAVFSVDGGGSAIATGTVSGTARIPNACTLTGWSITATGATGTVTVKFWNTATGTAIPTIANVINTSGVSLTTGTAVASSTLTDFTDTSYAAGDMIRCAITAVDSAATDLTVTLYGTLN